MARTYSPGFLRLVEDARSRVREFSVEEFLTRLEQGERFVLLDVREEPEWSAGHLPGAHHLSRGVLERDIEDAIPDPATAMVLYCDDGMVSALAADSLQRMGYAQVVALGGGWLGWREHGLPVVTPDAVP